MRTFREWRHESEVWAYVMRGYRVLKRGWRTACLPPVSYFQYIRMCRHYLASQYLHQLGDTVDFRDRPFCKYLQKGLPGRVKLRHAIASLHFLEHTFSEEGLKAIFMLSEQGLELTPIELKSGEHASLKLMRSRFPREGDIGLYLFDENGDDIYALTFSRGDKNKLYISGLQGPKPENGAELVKKMTKEMHGMRPKNLLISVLYGFCDYLKIDGICGIADDNHIKSKYLKSSYNAFWQECSAECHNDGWFHFPAEEPIRDISLVKSQHRSAFRKREALRAEVISQTLQTLKAYQPK